MGENLGAEKAERRLAEVEQALRVAAEHGVMTTDPEEVPWLIDQWLIRARAVLNNGGSRPMTEILSAEEVVSERYRYPDSTTEDGANDVIALCESHEALRARLAEVEAERDEAVRELDADDYEDQVCARVAAERRLAEVEQALREAKEALDKTVPVLLTVKPNLDRPYPDALTLTPWTRWCEPLARRVDDARRSARAVLDNAEPTDE